MKVRHLTRYDDTQNKIDLHKHKSASYEDEKNGFLPPSLSNQLN